VTAATYRSPRARVLCLLVMLIGVGLADSCKGKSPTAPTIEPLIVTFGDCTYTLDVSRMPALVPSTGTTFDLTMTTTLSSCFWSASAPSRPFLFLKFEPAQGTGSATIRVTVGPHTGTQQRTVPGTIATLPIAMMQSAAKPPEPGPNTIMMYSSTEHDSQMYGQAGVLTTSTHQASSPQTNFAWTIVEMRAQYASLPIPFPDTLRVQMKAPGTDRLTTGLYPNAQNVSLSLSASNGLRVLVNSSTCGEFEGQFEIFDIEQSPEGPLIRLHGRAVRRCTNDPAGTALTIEFWYPSKGSFGS